MILACVVMNLCGTRFVGESSILFVLFLLAPFVFLIWHGMIWHGTASPPLTAPALTRTDALGGILIAMWNYMGWDNASTIAGDVRNAPRTYSRAMGITLVVVVATYIAPILAVAHARVPLSAWETGSWVTLAALFGGPRLALFMTAAAVAAALAPSTRWSSRSRACLTPWRATASCRTLRPRKSPRCPVGRHRGLRRLLGRRDAPGLRTDRSCSMSCSPASASSWNSPRSSRSASRSPISRVPVVSPGARSASC